MTPDRARVPIAALLLVAGAWSCAREALTGPPALRLGRDECAECGMIISEDRSASAMLVERRGRREHLLYDDIGCMLDDERDGVADAAILERHVRDHATREWVRADAATYVLAGPDALPTPMGSGIAAFATRARADEANATYAGHVIDFDALVAARKAWMEERFGKPAGGSP